jgi:hypothetical protein
MALGRVLLLNAVRLAEVIIRFVSLGMEWLLNEIIFVSIISKLSRDLSRE